MRLNMTHDVVVPIAVTAATVAVKAWDRKRGAGAKPYAPALNIAGLIGGFAMQKMNWAPEIGNSIALCCAVPALSGIYDWAMGAVSTQGIRSTVARRVAGPVVNPLTAFDKSGI